MTVDNDIFESDLTADFRALVGPALERGFTIHPIHPRDKNPWLPNWPKRASRKPEVISEWCTRFPTSNYGVVADDTFCILESDNFAVLLSMLDRPLPNTYMVAARDNRPHLYFRQTPVSRAAGNMDSPGIFEFKQNNKYVVGEGSVHPSGTVYKAVQDFPIVEIPDWLVARLAEIRSGSGLKVSAPAPAPGVTYGEGEGRHPMLVSQAGRMWDGKMDETAFFDRLNAVNLAHCDPPRSAPHILDIVRHFIEKREPVGGKGPVLLLSGTPANHDPFDFVLGACEGEEEGCFAAESLHLIQGASGTGKTTLGIQLLQAQASSREFFGRKTYGKSYLVVMQDRGKAELTRTLHRMKCPELPYVALTSKQGLAPVAPTLEQLYLTHGRPQILFVEGLDMWVKDQSSMDAVSAAVGQIREVAEHYHVSIIGTVGTPKMKPKEKYASPRDRAFGSAAWARKADTVVDITEDPETHTRFVWLLLRNAAPQGFEMEFRDGLLARRDVSLVVGDSEAIEKWHQDNPAATTKQIMERFGVSERTAQRQKGKYQ